MNTDLKPEQAELEELRKQLTVANADEAELIERQMILILESNIQCEQNMNV